MDTHKDLILILIKADLKHNQLMNGLSDLHLESDMYFLGLHQAIEKLMKVPGDDTLERWFAIYDSFMLKAHHVEVTNRGDNLLPMAEECYRLLKAFLETEKLLTKTYND